MVECAAVCCRRALQIGLVAGAHGGVEVVNLWRFQAALLSDFAAEGTVGILLPYFLVQKFRGNEFLSVPEFDALIIPVVCIGNADRLINEPTFLKA